MSDLLVKVVRIDEVLPHDNAEKLEIVKIEGWQIVSGKGNYRVGDLAVHVPPDAMVPKTLADEWGVSQYLSWRTNAAKGRVKAVKLRGIASHGFLAPTPAGVGADENLAEKLEIEKYEEIVPIGMQAGQMTRNHPLFHTYTDIQNLRNYKNKFCYDDPVVLTEKIHGTNSRIGWIRVNNADGTSDLELAIGTHHTQRKTEDPGVYGLPWQKHEIGLRGVLQEFVVSDKQVNSLIFFGEIFGVGVQDLHYGAKQEKEWRLFDIAVNGEYLNFLTLQHLAKRYDLPLVPTIGKGCFDFEKLIELAQGKTIMNDDHIREGIVIRPLVEEKTYQSGSGHRRMIFKIISDDYLTRKGGTEHH